MLMKVQYLRDLADLFFPRLCMSCARPLQAKEDQICLFCSVALPRTGYFAAPDNPVFRLFMGRIQLVQADSWLLFRSRGNVRRMMHQLKYKGEAGLGPQLGRIYGTELGRDKSWIRPDLITCVPLHPARQKKRGYNQAELLAQGFAEALGIPFRPEILQRSGNKASQTGFGRYDRWENSKDVFKVNGLKGDECHIAVFDDVITTGSTLESCCRSLQQSGITRISVFSLCVAER